MAQSQVRGLSLRHCVNHETMLRTTLCRLPSPACRPVAQSAIAEHCYILARVITLFFFRKHIFQHPWTDFREALPHYAACSEINYVIWGFHMCPH